MRVIYDFLGWFCAGLFCFSLIGRAVESGESERFIWLLRAGFCACILHVIRAVFQ